jgi:hypothetical protein
MRFSLRNIVLTLVVCGGLIFAWGCTQHKDVVQPQTSSTITLTPAYLPELDTLYVYQLWMVKVPNSGDDYTASGAEFTSLMKFTWDNASYHFLDMSGNVLPNSIELPESWFAYDYIVISVENKNDAAPNDPSGVYILADQVIDQNIRPIVMKFPASQFLATGFYFVGTPTNDTTYYDLAADSLVRVSTEEQKGVWICSRYLTERNLHDTLAVLSVDTGMVVDTFDTVGKYDPDTINVIWPPDSMWTILVDTVVFGYDTLQHRRIDISWEVIYDTVYNYNLFIDYNIDSMTTVAYPYPLGRIPYYEYSGPLDGLADISAYGWRYNAWVMLEQPTPDTGEGADLSNTGMDLSPMIPFGDGRQEAFTGMNTWGVLPLGAFDSPIGPDLSNPYIDNREVPQFPGEDFVKNASPRFDNLNLWRVADHRWGSVIIGMEPIPTNVDADPNTNFPLFVLSADLPNGNTAASRQVQVFHNWTQFLPEIAISVEMHD